MQKPSSLALTENGKGDGSGFVTHIFDEYG